MASLEELKKRLYRGGETFEERMISPDLSHNQHEKTFMWSEHPVRRKRWHISLFWVFGAVMVIVLAGILYYIIIAPDTLFQPKTVDIKIIGDTEIKSGDRITWQVKLTNQSGVALESATLVFNFPEGTVPVLGVPTEGVSRERKPIGLLSPQETVTESFHAYVYGGRGSSREVSAVLEYRPEGSSGTVMKDASFAFSISRSPLSVSFDMPQEVRIGQEVSIDIHYLSQAEKSIDNLWLQLDLPDDFEFLSSNSPPQDKVSDSLKSTTKQKFWRIGELIPAAEGIMTLKGKIKGMNLDPRSFRGTIGVLDEKGEKLQVYDSSVFVATLRSPFLEISLLSNDKKSIVVNPGDTISVDVLWRNNVPLDVSNATLEVSFADDIIDLSTLNVEHGAYNQVSRSILWNASSYTPFQLIAPNASGKMTFSFKIKNYLPRASSAPRPVVNVNATFRPGAAVPGYEGTDLSGSGSLEMKVSSRLQLSSRVLYFDSLIPNTGPLPPQVGKETTYTVTWSLANMANDVDGAAIKSSLPPYVSFKNSVNPSDASLLFDPNGHTLEWKIGKVPAGTGFVKQALSVAFQIGIVPSPDQVGRSPVLINSVEAIARDVFTNQTLSSRDDGATTDVPDDANVSFDKKKVAL